MVKIKNFLIIYIMRIMERLDYLKSFGILNLNNSMFLMTPLINLCVIVAQDIVKISRFIIERSKYYRIDMIHKKH